MFSWNVNYGKFQNPWPRDKFSFTLFPGTGNPLAFLSEHQLTFQSPQDQSQMAVPPGPCCLGPFPPCQSSESQPLTCVSGSHLSSPQPQVSKVALKKPSFIRLPETHSRPFSGPEPLLTRKDSQVRLFLMRFSHHPFVWEKSFLCLPRFCFCFACLRGSGISHTVTVHFISWLTPYVRSTKPRLLEALVGLGSCLSCPATWLQKWTWFRERLWLLRDVRIWTSIHSVVGGSGRLWGWGFREGEGAVRTVRKWKNKRKPLNISTPWLTIFF